MDYLNKIICGDSVEVLKQIPDKVVDLIVTSPPYNLGIEYDNYEDKREWDSYYKWCGEWLKELYRVLKDDGRFCLNHFLSLGQSNNRYAPLMTLNSLSSDIGFKHHGLAVWEDITLSKRTAWGSWLSSSAPYVNSPYEGILILYKDRWKRDNPGKTSISKEEFMMACSGVWKIQPEKNRKNHPAPFPKTLSSLCIKLLSYEGDLILDPFCGSGTTLLSSKENKRNYIGIDMSPKYCELSERRVAQELLNYGV